MAEILIICPTHDHADALLMSIASVRAQSVEDWRMVVICDGSPPRTIEILEALRQQDPRIEFVVHPKGERYGEAYRDPVIRAASEPYVCHLSDDDLWAPDHLQTMVTMLSEADWASQGVLIVNQTRQAVWLFSNDGVGRRRNAGIPGRGLNNVAYRRAAYLRLPEGWTPAPEGRASDKTMWAKFFAQPDLRVASSAAVTFVKLPSRLLRRDYTATDRAAELGPWLARIGRPGMVPELRRQARVLGDMLLQFNELAPIGRRSFEEALAELGLGAVPGREAATIGCDGAVMTLPLTPRQHGQAMFAFRSIQLFCNPDAPSGPARDDWLAHATRNPVDAHLAANFLRARHRKRLTRLLDLLGSASETAPIVTRLLKQWGESLSRSD